MRRAAPQAPPPAALDAPAAADVVETDANGKGVYRLWVEGASDIAQEMYLGFVLDRKSERIMIVELSARRAIDFSHSADPMRYTNHSCRPNARLCIRQGRVEFYALRAIEPGEEITVDYGETHHEGRLACRCSGARV